MSDTTRAVNYKLEFIAPGALVPYENNARVHPEKQIKKLMASIEEFDIVLPILIDDANGIIAGHGIVEAASRLGRETVPCLRASHLSEAQVHAYIIADNRLAEDSRWDEDTLKIEMLRLRDDFGVKLNITGFENREVLKLRLDVDLSGDEDAPVEEPDIIISKPGDVWILGEHRLICGSSTDAATVAALLGDALPVLMVTDPPYGVNYDPSWRNTLCKTETKRTGKVLNDDRDDWREAWALFPGDVAYVWHSGLHCAVVGESLKACGFVLRSQIIWAKTHFPLSRGDYHWQHEPCWYAVREKKKSRWTGSRSESTLWKIDFKGQDTETTHGTQKPVECMRRPMLNNSEPGDIVYEPFSGSGTTLIAAESCRRRCFAVELDPKYVDMAVLRWQGYTSRPAVLEATGQTFDAVAQERKAAA